MHIRYSPAALAACSRSQPCWRRAATRNKPPRIRGRAGAPGAAGRGHARWPAAWMGPGRAETALACRACAGVSSLEVLSSLLLRAPPIPATFATCSLIDQFSFPSLLLAARPSCEVASRATPRFPPSKTRLITDHTDPHHAPFFRPRSGPRPRARHARARTRPPPAGWWRAVVAQRETRLEARQGWPSRARLRANAAGEDVTKLGRRARRERRPMCCSMAHCPPCRARIGTRSAQRASRPGARLAPGRGAVSRLRALTPGPVAGETRRQTHGGGQEHEKGPRRLRLHALALDAGSGRCQPTIGSARAEHAQCGVSDPRIPAAQRCSRRAERGVRAQRKWRDAALLGACPGVVGSRNTAGAHRRGASSSAGGVDEDVAVGASRDATALSS